MRLDRLDYDYIASPQALKQLSRELAKASLIGLDTEFVSEDCHEPDLCLVQLATPERLYLVDPQEAGDLDVLWEVLTEGDHETIVHSGREELRFALRATNRRLSRLFDIQLAAGFTGLEYPAAYSTVVTRVLDETLDKGETRTNWRSRPLSKSQLSYALQDVVHLLQIKQRLSEQLHQLKRWDWFEEEMDRWQGDVEAGDSEDRWRKISGAASLPRRGLEILRVLWHWRDEQARQRNRPARRILRDDLMVELAKRETADPRRIRSVRGLERSDYKRHLPEFSSLIGQALEVPIEECPPKISFRGNDSQYRLLGQFLVAAAGCFCRDAQIAASLVGTAQDFREFASFRLKTSDFSRRGPPKLVRGWRSEFIAPMLDDLLQGKLAVRIADPRDEQPLSLVQAEERGN